MDRIITRDYAHSSYHVSLIENQFMRIGAKVFLYDLHIREETGEEPLVHTDICLEKLEIILINEKMQTVTLEFNIDAAKTVDIERGRFNLRDSILEMLETIFENGTETLKILKFLFYESTLDLNEIKLLDLSKESLELFKILLPTIKKLNTNFKDYESLELLLEV